jgi:hypothetical protein
MELEKRSWTFPVRALSRARIAKTKKVKSASVGFGRPDNDWGVEEFAFNLPGKMTPTSDGSGRVRSPHTFGETSLERSCSARLRVHSRIHHGVGRRLRMAAEDAGGTLNSSHKLHLLTSCATRRQIPRRGRRRAQILGE